MYLDILIEDNWIARGFPTSDFAFLLFFSLSHKNAWRRWERGGGGRV